MKRIDCLVHPPVTGDETLIVIHTWQVIFCKSNVAAAALLSFFEYFHSIKLAHYQQSVTQAEQSKKPAPDRNKALLQWHTQKEMLHGIARVCKTTKTLKKAIDFLVSEGVVTLHDNPNPKYSFDNTGHYLFRPEIVQGWINDHYDMAITLNLGQEAQGKALPPKEQKKKRTGSPKRVSDMTGAEMLAACPHRKNENERWQMAIMGTFLVATGYNMPEGQSEIGFWWGKIREIYNIAGKDTERAILLVNQAVTYCLDNQTDINSPKSIMFKVRSLSSKVHPQAGLNGRAVHHQGDCSGQFLSETERQALETMKAVKA